MLSIQESGVREAIQKYVDGCAAADPAAVRDSFDSDAIMWGYLGGEYSTMSGSEFVDRVVRPAPPASTEFSCAIHSILIQGDIAHAVLDEQQFLGQDFRNFFGLIRRDGVWRIASKIFTTL